MTRNYTFGIIWMFASFVGLLLFSSNGYTPLEAMFIGVSFIIYHLYILTQEIINKIEGKSL